jgi:Antitoxin VbhA
MKAALETVKTVKCEPAFRREHLEEALANAALEGLHPTPEALADLEKVADGLLTTEEYFKQLNARYGVSE